MADLAKLVDDLSSLTVLEAAELSKLLEEKWGVSAAAAVAVAAAPGPGAAAAPVEEQTEFTVVLAATGDKKIEVIKEALRPGRPPNRSGLRSGRQEIDGPRRSSLGPSCRPRRPGRDGGRSGPLGSLLLMSD